MGYKKPCQKAGLPREQLFCLQLYSLSANTMERTIPRKRRGLTPFGVFCDSFTTGFQRSRTKIILKSRHHLNYAQYISTMCKNFPHQNFLKWSETSGEGVIPESAAFIDGQFYATESHGKKLQG